MAFILVRMESPKNISKPRRRAWRHSTLFSSLFSVLFVYCTGSLCDKANKVMTVVLTGCLYNECFFKYSDKFKYDIATQEILLINWVAPPRKSSIICLIYIAKGT